MEKYRHYSHDIGQALKVRALEAKRERDTSSANTEERTFHAGRLMAFNEALSIMQQEATGFDIPWADLCLDDVDPDRDLV